MGYPRKVKTTRFIYLEDNKIGIEIVETSDQLDDFMMKSNLSENIEILGTEAMDTTINKLYRERPIYNNRVRYIDILYLCRCDHDINDRTLNMICEECAYNPAYTRYASDRIRLAVSLGFNNQASKLSTAISKRIKDFLREYVVDINEMFDLNMVGVRRAPNGYRYEKWLKSADEAITIVGNGEIRQRYKPIKSGKEDKNEN